MNKTAGFIRTEWAVACVALSLLAGILLKFANIWLNSETVALAANIATAIPAVLILALLALYLVMRPFIDRKIIREMQKLDNETKPPTPDNTTRTE